MSGWILLAMAVAPGLAIAIFVYWKDKFESEPRNILIFSFFLGMVAILPAIYLEELGLSWVPPVSEMLRVFIIAFIVVGASEELSKFVMLRFYAYRKKEFNEPFDGITYAVMVSMGFATLGNIM